MSISRSVKISSAALFLAVGMACGVFAAQTARAEQGDRTVLDGVYTAEQAARGETAYRAGCGGCHMDNAPPDTIAPSLVGRAFIDSWREYDLGVLFTYLRMSMPPSRGGTFNPLADDVYLDIIAHLLQRNQIPAGTAELGVDDLESIRFVGLDGPRPLPVGALTLAVGCLVRMPDSTWMLHNAGPAMRAKTEAFGTTPEEIESSRSRPLGTGSFELRDINYLPGFEPEDHEGHKMQAKGLMIRVGATERIGLTSMEVLDTNCVD